MTEQPKTPANPVEHRSEFWPIPGAHRAYWERHNCAHVYEYDPADDGPEVETTLAVTIMHDEFELNEERADSQYTSWLIGRIVMTLRNPDVHPKTLAGLLLAAKMSVFADRIELRGVSL